MARTSAALTHGSKSSCSEGLTEETCSHVADKVLARNIPPFHDWRARSLFGQELVAGAFILAMVLLFFYHNHQGVCALRQHYPRYDSSCISNDRINAEGDRISGTCAASAAGTAVNPISLVQYTSTGLLSLASDLMCQSNEPRTNQITLGVNRVLRTLETLAQQCQGSDAISSLKTAKSSKNYLVYLSKYISRARGTARCLAANVAVMLVSKGLRALLMVLQILVTISLWGILAGDPFMFLAVPLRFSLVGLLLAAALRWRLPAAAAAGRSRSWRSSSSSSRSAESLQYWHRSRIRHSMIILQRLLPHVVAVGYAAAAAAMLGADHSSSSHRSYLNVCSLKHWLGYSIYLWTGWLACMLQLPLKMQLIISFLEWVFTFWASSLVREIYGSSSSSSSAVVHWIASSTLIWIVPSVVVWVMERSDREKYNVIFRLDRGYRGNRTCAESQQQQQQQVVEGRSGALEQPSIVQQQASSTAAAAAAAAARCECSSSSGASLVRDLGQSLQVAAAATLQTSSSHTGSRVLDIPIPVQAAAIFSNNSSSSGSSSVESMRRLVPALRGLLPDDDVAAVFELAAARQASQVPPGYCGLREYQSVAATLPVSVKVHSMPHTSVPVMGPQLTAALEHQITMHSSSTKQQQLDTALVQMHSVCFPGCVQLLACVFGLRQQLPAAAAAERDPAAAAADQHPAPAGGSNSSSSTRELAAGLLSAVCKVAESQHSSTAAAAAAGPSGVDVVVGSTVASVSGSSSSSKGVRRGSCCESETAGGGGSSSTVAELSSQIADQVTSVMQPQYKTLWCEPCCLTAASTAAAAIQQQQLDIHLQPCVASSSSSSSSSGDGDLADRDVSCRSLVFQFGRVVLDQVINLEQDLDLDQNQDQDSDPDQDLCRDHRLLLRISLPALPIGVVQIALLPVQQQQQQQEEADLGADHPSAASDHPSAAAAESPLLLLQPLLVLPAAAAAELEECRRQLCAAATAANSSSSRGNASGNGIAAAAAAAWSCIEQLSTDIGYLMSVAAAAVAAVGDRIAEAAAPHDQAAAAAAAAPLKPYPPPVTTCLAHVCKALARNGMSATLEFLVLYMATAAAAAAQSATAAAASDQCPSSSSSGGTDGSSCDNLAEADKAINSAAAAAADEAPSLTKPNDKQSSNNGSNLTCSGTSILQLLFGFKDSRLESQYLARTYASSKTVEIISFAWTAALLLVLWTAVGKWPSATAFKLVIHCMIVFVGNVVVPFAVLVLRWHVTRQLPRQQRQQQHSTAAGSSSSSSSAKDAAAAAGSNVSAAAATDVDLQQRIYANASKQKAVLMAGWMLLLSLLHCLFASGKLTLPADATKAWGEAGLVHTLAFWVMSGVKACMYQLPLAWFIPLFACELATHTLVSLSLGAGWIWALARVIPGFLIAVGNAGWQNYHGRRQSMRSVV